jgi:uncharacterized protein YfaP (DUF2135 family)
MQSRLMVGLPLLLLLLLLLLVAVAGCGGSQESSGTESAAVQKPKPAVAKPVTIMIADAPVKGRTARVIGKATPADATVRVNGKPAHMTPDGRFSRVIKLHLGENRVNIVGRSDGFKLDREQINVTRGRTKAEEADLERRQAARRARARLALRLAREREETDFKAAAHTIPFNQLDKNPDAHRGEKVVYHGQIFQIQERSSGGGLMLLSVTAEGYGIWSDQIWVDYHGRVKGAEDDTLTVYGTVKGSKSYDTQIGGSRYVPRIAAKYIVE